MSHHHQVKATLKRGALVAAANWPVTLIQATADSILKILIAVPVVGGVFLVALALGTDPQALMTLDWREMAPTIVGALLSRPLVLTLFLLAVAVVAIGGSLFVFLVKAGTVGVLAQSELEAPAIEQMPVHVTLLHQISRFSVDRFLTSSRALFPAFARLGTLLLLLYVASAAAYLLVVNAARAAGWGWAGAFVGTCAFVAWITVVNLLYLLVQVAMASDQSGVSSGVRRVSMFLRHEGRLVWRIFLVVLVIVLAASGASLLAAAALGLIWFVPLVGVAVLPLQLLASVLRTLVFQYIGLTSVGAYLSAYRQGTGTSAAGRVEVPYRGLSQVAQP